MLQQEAPDQNTIASSALAIVSCEDISLPTSLRARVKQVLVRLNGGWQFITAPVSYQPQTDVTVRAGESYSNYVFE